MARPPATLSSALLLIVGTSSALRLPPALLDISRQGAAGLACAALLATSQPVMPAFAAGCQLDCFKECNKVPAPAAHAHVPHSSDAAPLSALAPPNWLF